MIEITTPGRLHVGLLNPGPAGPGGRRFGGAGLMIRAPGVRLRAEPAADWSAEGPLAGRAIAFARRFAAALAAESGAAVPPQRLAIEEAPPEHVGLGSGTQLGLAVARALALAAGRPDLSAADLARLVGRGLRSAVGAHGFAGGGFVVDAGHGGEGGLAPLVARVAVPEGWRVVLALPPDPAAWHGGRERRAFDLLAARPSATDRMCRLLLLGVLPALAGGDLDAFGEALHEYNVRAGEAFAPAQGGTYSTPRVAELVAFIRSQGVKGTGQTSWGPAVFAVAGDEDRARALADRLHDHFGPEVSTRVSPPCNRGACVSGPETGQSDG